jgi:hypothetical protein
MGFGARRWVVGGAMATVAGALVLSQASLAIGATAARAAGSIGAAPAARAGSAIAAGRASSGASMPGSVYAATGRTLRFGMRGPAVRALQLRLNYLHYYAGRPDGHFGWSTMEAVWAFKEVQSGKVIPRHPDIVGPAMQRQLRHPRLPKAFKPHGGPWRIEIHKSNQVLILYHRGKIELISHTSTAKFYRSDGSGWVTPDGHYHALSFIHGWACGGLGCMWNPVFFISTLFAIHGEPNPPSTFGEAGVPLNPASHGCVRIPWDISQFLHRRIRIGAHGTPIYIFGPNYYH